MAQALSKIFETPTDDKYNKVYNGWQFSTLDKFIISFEKLTQENNIKLSKQYGNIAKQLTKDILEEDLGGIDLETGKKFTRQEIINHINEDQKLKGKFRKLYEEISKRNFWKLQTPVISTKYDLQLDRCNNDYERFDIIYKIFILNEKVEAKDIINKKWVNVSSKILEGTFERNEIEKIFFFTGK